MPMNDHQKAAAAARARKTQRAADKAAHRLVMAAKRRTPEWKAAKHAADKERQLTPKRRAANHRIMCMHRTVSYLPHIQTVSYLSHIDGVRVAS